MATFKRRGSARDCPAPKAVKGLPLVPFFWLTKPYLGKDTFMCGGRIVARSSSTIVVADVSVKHAREVNDKNGVLFNFGKCDEDAAGGLYIYKKHDGSLRLGDSAIGDIVYGITGRRHVPPNPAETQIPLLIHQGKCAPFLKHLDLNGDDISPSIDFVPIGDFNRGPVEMSVGFIRLDEVPVTLEGSGTSRRFKFDLIDGDATIRATAWATAADTLAATADADMIPVAFLFGRVEDWKGALNISVSEYTVIMDLRQNGTLGRETLELLGRDAVLALLGGAANPGEDSEKPDNDKVGPKANPGEDTEKPDDDEVGPKVHGDTELRRKIETLRKGIAALKALGLNNDSQVANLRELEAKADGDSELRRKVECLLKGIAALKALGLNYDSQAAELHELQANPGEDSEKPDDDEVGPKANPGEDTEKLDDDEVGPKDPAQEEGLHVAADAFDNRGNPLNPPEDDEAESDE